MAGKKLSPAPRKTAANAPGVVKANRVSMSDGAGRERSVSIRKIDNGYIVSETTYGPKGEYRCKETFSNKPPTVQVAPTKGK